MQAGIRTKDLAFFIIAARFMAPVVLGTTAIVLIYFVDYWPEWAWFRRYMTVAGVSIRSYKAPDIWLKNKVTKRSPRRPQGPSGCARPACHLRGSRPHRRRSLRRVSPGNWARPIRSSGDEFGLTAIELGFLAERRNAFENLAMRVDLEAVRGVVTTMIQTEKYGTPLASALRVLSAEFRNERMMRAEEKAARLPAIMTVPLILFILPTLFIVILGPAACSISDNFLNS